VTNIVAKAAVFATLAHDGQVRKYTGDPYIVHPAAVAAAVTAAGADDATIAAAWLHDVLEDCAVTYEDLVAEFGSEIADLVNELTHVWTPETYPFMNRAERKAWETARLATISERAKLVKRADFADNAGSIVEHDPEFAKVFLAEMAAAMAVLT
jgi:(p)ppGpp synthase/HD superfamily hydrolase